MHWRTLLLLAEAGWFGENAFDFSRLITMIDGLSAWVSLGLTIFVGIMGLLPFGAAAAAVPALAGMGLMLFNLVLQIYLTGGSVDEKVLSLSAFWDFVFLALSYYFASSSRMMLLILGVYVFAIGIPGAIQRCNGTCFDFASAVPW